MSSEKLASAPSQLKGNLGGNWNILDGASGQYQDLGIARRFGGASAAFSLRDIGAMNGEVVRVRREPHDTGASIDDERKFSANQVSSGVLEDWVNGKLEDTLPADVATAAAAFSLRKVNSAYGIPVTKISSANIFPTSLTTSPQNILTSDGSNSGFNIRDFANPASNPPTSSSSTINGNSWTVEATVSDSARAFAKSVRIFGLETNKQYVVKGEARMVTDTTASGDSFFRVDISDADEGDEDKVSMSPTSFTPFLIDVGYTADADNAFVDFTVSTNVATTGTIKAEFRNVQIIENENSAVRIRRSSDDVEVTVGFDSGDKVSLNSPIVNHSEDSNPDTQTTTATDLNGFLNETKSNSFTSIIQSDIHNFNHWDSASSSSTDNNETFTLSATQGTASQTGARWAFNLPATISATDSSLTTFRVSGTLVNYTSSTGSLNSSGFFIKQGKNNNTSSSSDFGNLTDHTGVGTIQVNKLRFNPGDSGDFSFVCQGDDEDFRSFVFLQTNLTGGTISISFTNLKFEIIKHGASVHTWYDQAGANNAVQETASNQPQIATNGALVVDANGRATLDFPNASTSDTHRLITSFVGGNLNSLSVVCVCKSDNTNTLGTAGFSQPFTQGTYSSNERFFIAIDKDEANWHLGYGTSLTDLGTPVTTNQTLFSIYGGTLMLANINAVQKELNFSQNKTITSRTDTMIGGHTSTDAPWDGTISELIYYNSDQAANRFKIESNINNYYGLYNDENELVSDFAKSGLATISNASKNGFTGETTDGNDAYFGVELNEKVASSDIVYISFNSTKASSSGDGVGLRKTSIDETGTLAQSSITSFRAGFNSIALTSSDSDAKFISFVDDSDTSFTISNFRVSRIARNGFVQTWYDQSKNGQDATQTTATQQPELVVNGGIAKNSGGLPSPRFSRVADNGRELSFSGVNADNTSFYVVNEQNRNFSNVLVSNMSGNFRIRFGRHARPNSLGGGRRLELEVANSGVSQQHLYGTTNLSSQPAYGLYLGYLKGGGTSKVGFNSVEATSTSLTLTGTYTWNQIFRGDSNVPSSGTIKETNNNNMIPEVIIYSGDKLVETEIADEIKSYYNI
jgi:hypothetical protein